MPPFPPASPRTDGHTAPPKDSGSHLTQTSRSAELAGLLWFSAVFAGTMGLRNGQMNQVFYLLRGLHQANPAAVRGDWYTELRPYHVPWNSAVAASMVGGSPGRITR